jgi:hypothetical protein
MADAAPNPVESPPLAPTQVHSKVGAGAVGGATSVVILWGIGLTGVSIPLEVGGAITTLISFAFGYIASS